MKESTAEKKFPDREGASRLTPLPHSDRKELISSLKNDPFLKELQDIGAEFFEYFSFKPNLGRIWITLFYSITPLSQRELMQILELSAGTVSQTLNELANYDMIIPFRAENRRELLYRCEYNLAKIASSILAKREKQILAQTVEKVEDLKIRMTLAFRDSELENMRIQGLEEIAAICNLALAIMTLFDVFSRHSYHAVKLGVQALTQLKMADLSKWLSLFKEKEFEKK